MLFQRDKIQWNKITPSLFISYAVKLSWIIADHTGVKNSHKQEIKRNFYLTTTTSLSSAILNNLKYLKSKSSKKCKTQAQVRSVQIIRLK